jgi:predicted porin
MKKTLITLAILAASGAAMAQSTVTLYGVADLWLGHVQADKGTAPVSGGLVKSIAGTDRNLMQSSGVNGSRYGLRGSEDLGGGLTANFNLEQGFNLDDGAGGTIKDNAGVTQGAAFSRNAWLGIAGGFGAVKLGRIASTYYELEGANDGVFGSILSAQTVAFRTGSGNSTSLEVSNITPRFNNSIRYETPALAGITGTLQYGLTENKTAAVDAGANYSLSLAYASGPLSALLAYQSEKASGIATTIKNTRLGATYDFGTAKLRATYGKGSNVGAVSGAEVTEYQIGIDYPVSPALTLYTNYADSKDNVTLDANEGQRKAYGLGAKYILSKRTFLYGGYVNGKKTQNGAASDTTVSALALGLQHRF